MPLVDISLETWNKGRVAGERFYKSNPVASIEEMRKQVITAYLQLINDDTCFHDVVMHTIGFTYGYCDLDFRNVMQVGS